MDDLSLALSLADAADAIAMDRFLASDLVVETKPDMTPVSDADRAVEAELRRILERHHPTDAILGEEFGAREDRLDSTREWIIDPIDGTKSYVRGVPIWATLIAVREGDQITTGVVSAPALGRRWWATRGSGAFTSSQLGSPSQDRARGPLSASRVSQLGDASFGFSDGIGWDPGALDRLLDATWRQRGYGDFWSHMLVAEGAIDIAAEPELKVHDVAALVPIIEESGARATTFTGAALQWDDPKVGFSTVTTNGHLHDAVLDLMHS
jgi:histidinol-phosphatase